MDGLAEDQKEGGFPYGGMVSFRIRLPAEGQRSATGVKSHEIAETFLTSLRLFTLAESLGGVESLAELPSLMTHGSIPPAERALLGIGDDLIRLSCGIEDADDLIRDIERALQIAVHGKEIALPRSRANGVDDGHLHIVGGEDTPPLVG